MHYLWSATEYLLRALETLMSSRLHCSGLHHLGGGPTLFVANHFTRFETFLVPYVHWQHRRQPIKSLADASLFHGAFGNYLRQMGAHPTNDSNYKQTIIQDLACGRSNWVIFPEGSLIKNKRTIHDNQLHVTNPYYQGPPHTGASVFALQAEALRHIAVEPQFEKNNKLREWVLRQLQIPDLSQVSQQPLRIIPVTFTYFPIRPGNNMVGRLSKRFIKDLPFSIQEELEIEGNLLFGDTDIDIHFGEPVVLDELVANTWTFVNRNHPIYDYDNLLKTVIHQQRHELIDTVMRKVYSQTRINIDHLFCLGLYRSRTSSFNEQKNIETSFLTALALKWQHDLRIDSSCIHELCKSLYGPTSAKWKNIKQVALDSEALKEDGNSLLITSAINKEKIDYHTIRLRYPTRVIHNEACTSPRTCATYEIYNNLSSEKRRQLLIQGLEQYDQNKLNDEWCDLIDDKREPPPRNAHTLAHKKNAEVGILAIHGYLSAPAEMIPIQALADELNCGSLLPRLTAHGTKPKALRQVHYQDWIDDIERALFLMHLQYKKVILVGFSMGGLLAIQAAHRKPDWVAGLCTINSPIYLQDRRAHFAPLVKAWNRGLDSFGRESGRAWIRNESEDPRMNYDRHPPHSIHELILLINETKEILPQITRPLSIHQTTADPVVISRSADYIARHTGSEEVHTTYYPGEKHNPWQETECHLLMKDLKNTLTNWANEDRADLSLLHGSPAQHLPA